MPAGVSVAALHEAAAAAGIGFARGAAFFLEPADQPYVRLNFAAVDEPEIERGIAVLGRIAHEQVQRGGLDPPAVSSGQRAAR
jgi:DNA-binding transcriptional MocR family regulator